MCLKPAIKNLLIFGSCVTRDCFTEEVSDESTASYRINRYFARSSVLSQLAPPVAVNEKINLVSSFQQRMVRDDLEKNFFPYLEKVRKDIDYLLLDFVEERFDLAALEDSYVTCSGELLKSGLLQKYSCKRIPRKELDELYFKRLYDFIDKILLFLPTGRIIVHKVYFTPEYQAEGNVKRMPASEGITRLKNAYAVLKGRWSGTTAYKIACASRVEEWNRRMEKTYQELAYTYPLIRMVEAAPRYRVATPFHKWGMAPMHFVPEYYADIYSQIDRICNASF